MEKRIIQRRARSFRRGGSKGRMVASEEEIKMILVHVDKEKAKDLRKKEADFYGCKGFGLV